MAESMPPAPVISEVIERVRDKRRMAEGIVACAERGADFSSQLEMELTGVFMIPEARRMMSDALTASWARPYPGSSAALDGREVIIGGGYAAAVYAAGRVRAGFPRPVVLERGRPDQVGGAFAMSLEPVLKLNSRSRPGMGGLPDQDGALNYVPGGILQPDLLSSAEYHDNAEMAWLIRVTLAQFADVYAQAPVTRVGRDSSGRLYLEFPQGRSLPGRILDARGCGDPVALSDGSRLGPRIMTFTQFMERMGGMFPLRGIRRLAVIGGGNSGLCAAESALGIAPRNTSVIGLDYVRKVDLYAPELDGRTCDAFRQGQRGRYLRLAQYLEGNTSSPSARLGVIAQRATAVPLPEGVLVNERTYDMAVLCTGYALPVLRGIETFTFTDYLRGTTVLARRAPGLRYYRIGAGADIPFSATETEAGVPAEPANKVSMFRNGPRVAALAITLPAT